MESLMEHVTSAVINMTWKDVIEASEILGCFIGITFVFLILYVNMRGKK